MLPLVADTDFDDDLPGAAQMRNAMKDFADVQRFGLMKDMLKDDAEAISQVLNPRSGLEAFKMYSARVLFGLHELGDKYDILKFTEGYVASLEDAIEKNEQMYWWSHDYLESTDSGTGPWKSVLCKGAVAHMEALRKDERFQKMLRDDPEFCVLVLNAFAEKHEGKGTASV